MLKFLLIAALSMFVATAYAQNTPCSGKKGGVAACTKDGKFICQNSTISQSKKICQK
ncbi:hypothetical protein [uncultured Deefgea sp.]|uniref:hypothetical protein n=1 Tax=uncultured Deefgea sp. TaxID=1304914 RepID=UPI00262F9469|nr:hypothetical protein [uncultured Deefgea sp.]